MRTGQKKSSSRSSLMDEIKRRFSTWALQHAQAFVFSLGQLIRNPFGNLLTVAVIGISLALPTGFYILLENARQVVTRWGTSIQNSPFL